MAQYSKRGKGWQARIYWRDSFGKRHTKSKAGFKTKRLASQWAVAEENNLNQGINIEKEVGFADFFDQWFERYKEPKISEVTASHYRIVSKVIHEYFGNTKIKQIHMDNYQDFINQYGKDHAPMSVRKLNSMIRACVRFAIYDDYLIKDFTMNVSLTANKDKIVKVDYLNTSEIKKLVEETKSSINPKRRYTSKYMILLAIYTGMRLSEIQALTWNDIDLKNNTIKINKSWDANNLDFKPTKNGSSNRIIKVNHSILELIYRLKFGSVSNLIFLNQFGRIPSSAAVNKTLNSILKKLDIHRKNFHFHSLRHSHVALLLANGVDIYAISKRLGHSNTTTTSEVYAYLIDEYKMTTDQQIINALSAL